MIYTFDDVTLDTERREVTRGQTVLQPEPMALDLLILLVENHHRVVDRDELIEKIWRGRVVSDWAISSRIKRLRQLFSDDGKTQSIIQTLRGRGFRLACDVRIAAPQVPATNPDATRPNADEVSLLEDRPSIAVLPFTVYGGDETHQLLAEAVPRELITALASLRWIKVIAAGSSFRFRGPAVDVGAVGRVLSARYCLVGTIEVSGRLMTIDAELSDTRSRQVIWAKRKQSTTDDVSALRAEIVGSVMAVAELEIPQHEASLLDLSDIDGFNAWAAMHCGVQEMYKFTQQSSGKAMEFFEAALAKDPSMARAHAGISFVKFNSAFMRYTSSPELDVLDATRHAEKAVELQPRDPFVNFVMGRSHWLKDDPEGSIFWFSSAVDASPNHAMSHYGKSWAEVFTGQYDNADASAHLALDRSPLDPMRPGMTGTKMWVNLGREDYPEAVKWAETAARVPWSHAGMAFFAAMSNWLNGDLETARGWVLEVRRRKADFNAVHLEPLTPSSHLQFTDTVRRAAAALL